MKGDRKMVKYRITIHNVASGQDREVEIYSAPNIIEAQKSACRTYLHEIEFGVEQIKVKRI